MKLLVGLGNPGKNYSQTYHNIGFMAIDHLAASLLDDDKGKHKFSGDFWQGRLNNHSFGLFKPMTFMNLSGVAVAKALNFFTCELNQLLVVHDDLDLPFGKIRYRQNGGHGGHNGLRDIISHLKGGDFQRLKIGIGRAGNLAPAKQVLSPIHPEHRVSLAPLLDMTNDLLSDFIEDRTLQVPPVFT
ncbi:MAG: aminoacyl-tRNA hydrolase [SAR324 cluster bacterium]|nr:aminoacyl-tRNA hydrolase [SAR324 cluster bacterium]